MRSLGLLTAALVLGSACSAYAQVAATTAQKPVQADQASPAVAAPQNWPQNSTGSAAGNAAAPAPAATAPVAPQDSAPVVAAPQPAPAMAPAPAAAPVATPAASANIDSIGGGAIPALPLEIMTSGGVVFVSGGIGDEEMEMLKSREHEFNVKIMLSAPKGEFVSNITLRILDNKDTPLVGIPDAGPYVYAKMQPGTYFIETTGASGEKKKDKIVVTDKGMVKKHYTFNE